MFCSQKNVKTKDAYAVIGKLTMHGVTKTVTGNFTYEKNILSGTTNIKRLDYGVGEGTNTFMIGNDVSLKIACVLEN